MAICEIHSFKKPCIQCATDEIANRSQPETRITELMWEKAKKIIREWAASQVRGESTEFGLSIVVSILQEDLGSPNRATIDGQFKGLDGFYRREANKHKQEKKQ